MDRFALRRNDYSLSTEQEQLRAAYRDFLDDHCSFDVVRRAEPLGFDPELWARSVSLGATEIARPTAPGDDDAGLVELVLIAEELGRAAAPLCWVDHAVGSRLVTRHLPCVGLPQPVAELLEGADVDAPLGVDVVGRRSPQGHLICAGAVAQRAVVRTDTTVELWQVSLPPSGATSIGPIPAAWWREPERRSVLAVGDPASSVHLQLRAEWKLLTAATLLGMTAACLDDAVHFVTHRYTRGVPVGSLQAISHPLADLVVAVTSGINLTRRAAWMLEHEPQERPDLVPSAFVFAARTALNGLETCVHVQGGLGFTVESAVSAYFLRARALVAAGGNLRDDVLDVVAGLDRIRRRTTQAHGMATKETGFALR